MYLIVRYRITDFLQRVIHHSVIEDLNITMHVVPRVQFLVVGHERMTV